MAINKTLVWILAGGAALALGGVAVWLLRRRSKGAVLVEDDQSTPPEPDDGRACVIDWLNEPKPSDPDVAPEPEASEQPMRGRIFAVEHLRDSDRTHVDSSLQTAWPTRPHGPELEPEVGDDLAFVAEEPGPNADECALELVIAKIQGVGPTTFDVEILGRAGKPGLRPLQLAHGYAVGNRLTISRNGAAAIIKPEPPPVLAATNRRRRYKVGPGELISLRPDKKPRTDWNWSVSRPDVELRIVEQDDAQAVVVLDGPGGEVNVALLSPNGKEQLRPVCSWKFEIVEAAA